MSHIGATQIIRPHLTSEIDEATRSHPLPYPLELRDLKNDKPPQLVEGRPYGGKTALDRAK